MALGWLQPIHFQDWRKGKIPYLEECIQVASAKRSDAEACFQEWVMEKKLNPVLVTYKARTIGPQKTLQFSQRGDDALKKLYQQHYFSGTLSEKQQKKWVKKWEEAPDLVVHITSREAQCEQCGKKLSKGSYLLIEAGHPLCLECAELSGLEFLPSGNAKLTREAKKRSSRYAVVVKFSRARKRHERQGLLIERTALQQAEASMIE